MSLAPQNPSISYSVGSKASRGILLVFTIFPVLRFIIQFFLCEFLMKDTIELLVDCMEKYRYEIPLETPSKKNSRVTNRKTGRSFPNKKFVEWHKEACKAVLSQGVPDVPISGKMVVYGTFVRKDRRRRDNNNSGASILDLLVDCGVLADDNDEIVVRETWEKVGIDKDRPIARIFIFPLTNQPGGTI